MPSGGQSDEPGAGVRACLLRHARAHLAWVCSGPVETGVEVRQGEAGQGKARFKARRGWAGLGVAGLGVAGLGSRQG